MANGGTYDQLCKCCAKCGRTFYLKGNKQKTLAKKLNMKLRLHDKKCLGNLNLSDEIIDRICEKEIDAYNAPFLTVSREDYKYTYNSTADVLIVKEK